MNVLLTFLQKHQRFLLNSISIAILFVLPYYIFQGKLFIGGDDTRLIYAYPLEYLKALSFFSWINLSSIGTYAPNHFSLPFALVWYLLFLVTRSRVVIDYLSFSLPIVLSFIYFQKLIKELLPRSSYLEQYIATVFYILSPILTINQLSVFLMSAWLVGLFPFIAWGLIKYVKTANFLYVLLAVVMSIFLSLGFYSIPWIAGLLLPLFLALPVGLLMFNKQEIKTFLTRTIIFFGCILLSQSFWIIPFIAQFLIKGNAIGSLISDRASTFRATVVQTSTGNVVYPLLNLFHRDLTFTHDWDLRKVFLAFYDKIFFLSTIYIGTVFIGIFVWKKVLNNLEKNIYFIILPAFLLSLFFYTVNIGPLKEVFLLFGYVPGFMMFRNAFDKFAPGFVFIYTLLFAFSLFIVIRKFPKYSFLIILSTFLIIMINAIPLKETINSPLWTTNHTLRAITFPQEYFQFLSQVKKTTDPSGNILNTPLNIAGYAVVKDETSNSVFAGTSPTKFFIGVNDFSGDLSFSAVESGKMWSYINNRNYTALRDFLYTYNVDTVMVTKNIPQEVKASYLFSGGSSLRNQDAGFLDAITNKKLIVSSSGNYELYSVRKPNIAFHMRKGFFQKITPITYRVFMHLTSQDQLTFLDSYNDGWRLYLEKYSEPASCENFLIKTVNSVSECRSIDTIFQWNELSYLFKPSLAQNTHKPAQIFGNTWKIDPKNIQENYNKTFFKKNADGSIDVVITVYFLPQETFYIGSIITVLVLGGMILYLLFVSKKYRKKD